MKKSFILVLLLLPMLGFNVVHKFYLSVTEIEYSEKNNSLQIISRVFTDDMEDLLKQRYDSELFLAPEAEHPAVDKYLKKYLAQKLKIGLDGEQKNFTYVGKRYDKDQLVFYLEVEDSGPMREISVRNEVLTDLHPDQKNVVHVTFSGNTKSLLLSREEEQGLINFGNE